MFRKISGIAAASAIALISVSLATTTPASARSQCVYHATNGFGFIITKVAHARRMGTACRRAERRCNRELRRARRHRNVPRGNQVPVCRRGGVASQGT